MIEQKLNSDLSAYGSSEMMKNEIKHKYALGVFRFIYFLHTLLTRFLDVICTVFKKRVENPEMKLRLLA